MFEGRNPQNIAEIVSFSIRVMRLPTMGWRLLLVSPCDAFLGQVERAIHQLLSNFGSALDFYSPSMSQRMLAQDGEPALVNAGLPMVHARVTEMRAEVEASHVRLSIPQGRGYLPNREASWFIVGTSPHVGVMIWPGSLRGQEMLDKEARSVFSKPTTFRGGRCPTCQLVEFHYPGDARSS